jgi:hypothetical protein
MVNSIRIAALAESARVEFMSVILSNPLKMPKIRENGGFIGLEKWPQSW